MTSELNQDWEDPAILMTIVVFFYVMHVHVHVTEEQTLTMEEGSEDIGKDIVFMQRKRECRNWPQLS